MPVAKSKTKTRTNLRRELGEPHTCVCPDRVSDRINELPVELWCHLSDGTNAGCESSACEVHVLAFNQRLRDVDVVVDLEIVPTNWSARDGQVVRSSKLLHIPLAMSSSLKQGVINTVKSEIPGVLLSTLVERLDEASTEAWRPILKRDRRIGAAEFVQVRMAFEIIERWARKVGVQELQAALGRTSAIDHQLDAYGNGKVEAHLLSP